MQLNCDLGKCKFAPLDTNLFEVYSRYGFTQPMQLIICKHFHRFTEIAGFENNERRMHRFADDSQIVRDSDQVFGED